MERLCIPKFGGEDFAVWRCQVEAHLAVSDLLEVVDGSSKRPTEQGKQIEWDKNDRKARLIILSALETNVVRQIMNLKTSHEAWTRLSALYELRDKTSVQLLLQRFFDYRMTEGMSIGQHVSKIEEMARQLEDLGEKQSEAAMVTKTLHSLPRSYIHVISAWDSLPDEKQTMENLLPRLLKAEALNASMVGLSSTDNTPAALVHIKTGECNSKPKIKNPSTSKKPKFSGKCFNCGKQGHRKADCWSLRSERTRREASSMDLDGSLLMARVCGNNDLKDVWFADSGASHHMSPRRELFRNFTPIEGDSFPIRLGNKDTVYARGQGIIDADFYLNGCTKTQTLVEALYVPDISKNLFSIGLSTDHGAIGTFEKYEMTLRKNNNVVARGWRPGVGLYRLHMKAIVRAEANIVSSIEAPLNVWHERFGHVSYRTVGGLARGNAVTGIEVIDQNLKIENESFCEACVLGKMSRQPFQDSTNRAKLPGELIHYDICGPMSIEALDGSKLMALFVDDYSGVTIVFPIRKKSEIVTKVQEVIALAQAHGHQVRRLRSDNAKEFTSAEMMDVCRRNNIVHQYSTPYCPEQNGRVERQNRTIVEMARSMLAGANLSRKLWGEAVRTAAHIRNRIPLERLENKTPYEAWSVVRNRMSRIFAYLAVKHTCT